MHITIRERKFIDGSLAGHPWRILHTFSLGTQHQKQYDIQGAVHDHDGSFDPEDLETFRKHSRAAFLRTPELRKAAKRLTITFHVEQSDANSR